MKNWRHWASGCVVIAHYVTKLALIGGTIFCFVLSGLVVSGLVVFPSPTISVGSFAVVLPVAAIILFFAAMLSGLCLFIPSQQRVLQLELSHRNFSMTMSDIARAYNVAHQTDRAGVFRFQDEFDAIQERINFLKEHPDLDGLKLPVLEAAAKMSFASRGLALMYSDEKVTRARSFLTERQEDCAQLEAQIERARQINAELVQWAERIELGETAAMSHLEQLAKELNDTLERLNTNATNARPILPMINMEELMPHNQQPAE